MAWVEPRTWVDGHVTATMLNEIRDNLKAIGDSWGNYTPDWTAATTNPDIGNGAKYGLYMQAGNTIAFKIVLFSGTTTTQGTGAQAITLPVACSSLVGAHTFPLRLYTGTNVFVGSGIAAGGSTSLQPWVPTATNNCALTQMNSTSANIGNTGAGYMIVEGVYEAA